MKNIGRRELKVASNNICFVSGSIPEAQFLYRIGLFLRKKYRIDFHIIFTRKFLYDFFKKLDYANIHYRQWSYDFEQSNDNVFSQYRDNNLRLIQFSDPILSKMDSTKGLNVIVQHLRFWEDFLLKNKIGTVIHYPTASLLGRTSYVVCKKYGLKHFIIQTGPIVNETFTLCDINEEWIWKDFLDMYLANGIKLSNPDKSLVDSLVDKIFSVKNRSLRIRKIGFKTVVRFLYETIKYKRFDAMEINEFNKLFKPFVNRVPMFFGRYDLSQNEKFVFFPLHISWDAQIATRNPLFSNQLFLVDVLSKALPYGYELYVKEHPYNYGGETVLLLKKIKSYPNVKLVHPEISSIELIRKASAVVTINSTAGFEAILMKKPLLTFGNTFYSYFKHTQKVDCIGSLSDNLLKVLNLDWNSFSATEEYLEEWYRFLFSVYKTSKKGAANGYKNYMGLGINNSNDVIANVADSLWDSITK